MVGSTGHDHHWSVKKKQFNILRLVQLRANLKAIKATLLSWKNIMIRESSKKRRNHSRFELMPPVLFVFMTVCIH